MDNRKIIIYLITQELRYTQYYTKLQEWNMEPEITPISMLEVIKPLMGIPTPEGKEFPEISEKFCGIYVDTIFKVREFPNLMDRRDLEPLAEACYCLLLTCMNYEKKKWEELS